MNQKERTAMKLTTKIARWLTHNRAHPVGSVA